MKNQEYLRWLELAVDDADVVAELNEIRILPEQIHDRFYRNLEFGTGGMRGKLGAGTNRMNIYTVCQATRGLADYLLANQSQAAGVAISYDSRHKSQEFALKAAATLSAYGIPAKLFSRLMPTPALSFAVRRLGCGAGIMITASHNPSDYNGYKVYGPDGCQITSKAAESITSYIMQNDPLAPVPKNGHALIDMIPESIHEEYYSAVLKTRLDSAVPADILSIVYTPLHGAGLESVTSVLEKAGYKNVNVVSSQTAPDGGFPTCSKPNPELPEALSEGLKLCRKLCADILFATDPDCDRVGVAVYDKGGHIRLNGNEVGVLLLDYVCRMRVEKGTMPAKPIAVKTIVTSEMAKKVAREYGVELLDVLTGFKYIGESIGRLEENGEIESFVFGFEESCGYLSGTHARDKDAVNACLLICDMAAWYKARKMTLADALGALFQKHGYYASGLLTRQFDGVTGALVIEQIMSELRLHTPSDICGHRVCKVVDYLHDNEDEGSDNVLPSSNVLQFCLDDETLITFRPSGTEPLMKIYCSVTRSTGIEVWSALDDYFLQLPKFLDFD